MSVDLFQKFMYFLLVSIVPSRCKDPFGWVFFRGKMYHCLKEHIIQLLGHHATFLLAWRQYETLFTKGWAYEHWQSMPGWLFITFCCKQEQRWWWGSNTVHCWFTKTFWIGEHLSGKFSICIVFLVVFKYSAALHIYIYTVGYTLRLD